VRLEGTNVELGKESIRNSGLDVIAADDLKDGAQKIVELLRPMVSQANPQLLAKIDGNFKKVDAILSKYRTKTGFESYEKLTSADRNALKGPITALAEDLSLLRGTLGLD